MEAIHNWDNLTIDDMKEICQDIFSKESKRYDYNFKGYPLTFISFYKKYVKGSDYSFFNKIKLLREPLMCYGTNMKLPESKDINILIFLNRINKINDNNRRILQLVHTCYHEVWHSVQDWNDLDSYEAFIHWSEYLLMCRNGYDYSTEHDNFWFEAEANLYGIRQAKVYLRENFPDAYSECLSEMDRMEKKYFVDYSMFDASSTVDMTISLLRKIYSERVKSNKNNESALIDLEKIGLIPYSIFLNGDITFKKLSVIINDERFKKLDKRIIAAILSCKSFLNQIDFDSLSSSELEVLREALSYTKKIYTEQAIQLKKSKREKRISDFQYLKAEKNLFNKINIVGWLLSQKIDKQFKKIFNFKRNYYRIRKHKEDVDIYLEETENQINRRSSKGYLSITICYLLGLILSIITFIYIIIK